MSNPVRLVKKLLSRLNTIAIALSKTDWRHYLLRFSLVILRRCDELRSDEAESSKRLHMHTWHMYLEGCLLFPREINVAISIIWRHLNNESLPRKFSKADKEGKENMGNSGGLLILWKTVKLRTSLRRVIPVPHALNGKSEARKLSGHDVCM